MVRKNQKPTQLFGCPNVPLAALVSGQVQVLGLLPKSVAHKPVNVFEAMGILPRLILVKRLAWLIAILIRDAFSQVLNRVVNDDWRPDLGRNLLLFVSCRPRVPLHQQSLNVFAHRVLLKSAQRSRFVKTSILNFLLGAHAKTFSRRMKLLGFYCIRCSC